MTLSSQLRVACLFGSGFLVACVGRDSRPAAEVELHQQQAVTAFAAGSLVIPMDTTYQNNGMLRAYGLVYDLLQRGITVNWAVLPGKMKDGADFTATARDLRSGAQLTAHNYAGGPFVISQADRAAALPAVNAWLAANAGVNVHDMTAPFSADIARVLVGAPRIAVFIDGYQDIAYTNLNAAGIPDSQGNTWTAGSPDTLTEAEIVGPSTTNDADGALLSAGAAKYCHMTSMHYAATGLTNEVVQEVRSWLNTGPLTHGFMQCLATTTFENNASGHFISTNGIQDDGNPDPETTLVPDHPLSQFYGNLTIGIGLVDSARLAAGSAFRANTTTLINHTGDPTNRRIIWLTGFLDGDTNKGRLTYLGGHDFGVGLPITSNDGTNGVRLMLNSLFASDCATAGAPTPPTVTLTKSAPAAVGGGTITYTINYANSGPGVAEAATVRDAIPTGTAFMSATNGGAVVGNEVRWTIGNVAAGGSGSVSFTVSVGTDGTYTNTAALYFGAGLRIYSVGSNTSSTVRDTTAPDTTIVSGPPAVSTSPSATFDFSSNDATATFECSLDSAAFAACTDPVTFTGLAAGAHTLAVRARDPAGNVDATPATHNWMVDNAPLDTTIVSGPPMLTTQTSGSFDFSSNKMGVTYECSLDGAAFVACTDPVVFNNLAAGAHMLAVRARDGLGNVDPSPAMYSWTVDGMPPDTSIVSGPPAVTTMTSALFDFASTEASATFECSLDGAAYAACTDPATFTGLAEGPHTLAVRARDGAGNVDASPATHMWIVDTTAPDTIIVSGPPATGAPPSVTFDLGSNEMNVTYECAMDSGGFVACSDPATFTNLTTGMHTFFARAIDAAGNVDLTPTRTLFTVDATLLDTVIDSGPAKNSNQSRAVFDLSSNRAGATYECSLDGSAFAPCPDPATFTGLGDGPHHFDARAKDPSTAQVDATPAGHDWTIDTTPPDTMIVSGPPRTGAPTTATFDFSSSEMNVTYECRLDAGSFAACTDPTTLASLAAGMHTLAVRAKDAAGNVDPTPVTYDWVVGAGDAGAPDARPDATTEGGAGDGPRDGTDDGIRDGGAADSAPPQDDAANDDGGLFVDRALYGTGCKCNLGTSTAGGSSSEGDGARLLLLSPLVALLWRRGRRRRVRDASAPKSAHAGRIGLLLFVVAQLTAARTASAQNVKFPIANYRPTTTVESYFLTANGRTVPPLTPSAALSMNYAHNPLELVDTKNDQGQADVIKYQVNMDLILALGLLKNLDLALALPVTLAQGSDDLSAVGRTPGSTLGGGLGDVRIIPKVRVYGGDTLTLGLAAAVSVPTGNKQRFLGNDGPAVSPWLIIGVDTPVLSFGTNLGVRLRKDQGVQIGQQDIAVGNEAFASLGARIPLVPGTMDLIGDAYMAVAFAEQDQEEIPAELLGGFRFYLPAGMIATLGAGPGLTRGVGTPTFRVLGALAYAQGPSPGGPYDPDRDGIVGDADRCPNDPEDKDRFEDDDGCPDLDNDRDKIADAQDKCPNDPEDRDSFEDQDGCPDPDNDRDQVADVRDKCPDDPEDADGFRDDDGCPDPDNDEDKIADAQDKCPNEPETINSVDDEDGCPDKGKGPVQISGHTVTTPPVFFATNKDIILKRSFSMLTLVAKVLVDNTWIKRVRIAGHTDSQGDDERNKDLSQRRAASVMRFLMENGVEQNRLEPEGMGESEPIASNRTTAGRARNRRVEFIIVEPAGSDTQTPVN